jgi:DNA-binding transcriptional MerR regulator
MNVFMNGVASMIRESTIAEIADEFSISHRTLRLYEEKYLLFPRRDDKDKRWYDAVQRARLVTILGAKRLGFTLAEIVEILALGGVDRLPEGRRAAQMEHLEKQRREINAAIKAWDEI